MIDADDPEGLPVADVSQNGSGTGQTFANIPPGTYYLDIIASGLDYTIAMEQCKGGNPSTTPNLGEGKSEEGTPPKGTEPTAEDPRNTTQDAITGS